MGVDGWLSEILKKTIKVPFMDDSHIWLKSECDVAKDLQKMIKGV